MDINYISQNLNCSDEEKRSCLKMVQNIFKLANLSRQQGLLALEDEIKKADYDNEFLKIAVNYIINGTDPKIVSEILENYIILENPKNKNLLEYLIIYRGILLIQQGEHPSIILEILASYFGLNFRKTFFDSFTSEKTLLSSEEIAENLIKNLKSRKAFSEKTNLLNICKSFSAPAIQKILTELDQPTLTAALYGCDGEITYIFLMNMSLKSMNILYNDLNSLSFDEASIIKAQEKILEKIKYLEKSGEIVVCY